MQSRHAVDDIEGRRATQENIRSNMGEKDIIFIAPILWVQSCMHAASTLTLMCMGVQTNAGRQMCAHAYGVRCTVYAIGMCKHVRSHVIACA